MTQPKLLVYVINSSAVLKIFERARDGEGRAFRTEGQSQRVTGARDAELHSSALPWDTSGATGKL